MKAHTILGTWWTPGGVELEVSAREQDGNVIWSLSRNGSNRNFLNVRGYKIIQQLLAELDASRDEPIV